MYQEERVEEVTLKDLRKEESCNNLFPTSIPRSRKDWEVVLELDESGKELILEDGRNEINDWNRDS